MAKHIFMAWLVLLTSGCVSTTLESDQFRAVGQSGSAQSAPVAEQSGQEPVELGSVENPSSTAANDADPQNVSSNGREQVVQEMRAKAEVTSGEKTHIGTLPETAAPQLTAAEQAQKAQALKAKAAEANASVSDSEVETKQESIRRLQRKASSHYDEAIKRIEN